MKKYDYIIVGSGICGLSIARALKNHLPFKSILIIDKESAQAAHASGRNSGVLHAGFYYTANSLKAKFTVNGNAAMKKYCKEKGLKLNECGKLVVATNEEELGGLFELEKRGRANGSNVTLIDQDQATEIEPNVLTHQKALHSPDTASIDPKEVCASLKKDLEDVYVDFLFDCAYLTQNNNIIDTAKGIFECEKLINCAGLYADKIAQDYGLAKDYTMMPFKGLYLKYTKNKTDVKTNIYPVPNLKNPFLGVHYTKTVDQSIKIGPTAIPALWRENYEGMDNFVFSEFAETLFAQSKLFVKNSFGFRDLAFEEMRKYNKDHFISLAVKMVKEIDPKGFTEFTPPGIRAQLLDKRNNKLVQDFVVECDKNSIHILNAVSPAFTCAFSFADYVLKHYIAVN